MALGFRDREALVVALASGLCPADVAAGEARVARTSDGRLLVALRDLLIERKVLDRASFAHLSAEVEAARAAEKGRADHG